MKKIFTSLAVVVLIASIVFVIRALRPKTSETFDGYIVWGRESVVFVEHVEIRGDEIRFKGDRIWVEQSSIPETLYTNALVVGPSGYDDLRVIKVNFVGRKEEGAKGWYGHLGEYTAQVTIGEIVQYSTPGK